MWLHCGLLMAQSKLSAEGKDSLVVGQWLSCKIWHVTRCHHVSVTCSYPARLLYAVVIEQVTAKPPQKGKLTSSPRCQYLPGAGGAAESAWEQPPAPVSSWLRQEHQGKVKVLDGVHGSTRTESRGMKQADLRGKHMAGARDLQSLGGTVHLFSPAMVVHEAAASRHY